jgi:hypothetical protein
MIGKFKNDFPLEEWDFVSMGSSLARKEDGSDLRDAKFYPKKRKGIWDFCFLFAKESKFEIEKTFRGAIQFYSNSNFGVQQILCRLI